MDDVEVVIFKNTQKYDKMMLSKTGCEQFRKSITPSQPVAAEHPKARK